MLPCGGNELARGTLSRVVDGRDFVLADGREVRLAGIEVPLGTMPERPEVAPGGPAAKAALTQSLSGAELVLRRAEYESDRYGRLVAYVVAIKEGSMRLVQAELVSAGLARVGEGIGNRDCAAGLLRLEASSRRAKLGLWALGYYEVVPADRPAAVLARRGRFSLVEGEVVSVHASGATLYLNFGRHWSTDFAVTIRKRDERMFAAGGLDLQRLAGERVRVRGWVEQRGSAPWIEATRPEQIEPIELK